MRAITAILLASVLAMNACANHDLREGGLYSVEAERGGYSVVKILKLDPEGVHVRIYSNHFAVRPTDIDAATLYMAGVKATAGQNLGIGHLPLRRTSFVNWRPQFIKVVPVDPSELDGYEMWKEGNGGYF